jgi:hypothetical protein
MQEARVTMDTLLANVGGLSAPAKMPCNGWSIPATTCKLGSLLRPIEGTTCSVCYAMGGSYCFPCVVAAMERRFDIVRDMSPLDRLQFVASMSELLTRKAINTRKRIESGKSIGQDARYFRWFDSGDLQSVDMLAMICEIAEQAPSVTFWLPTRESATVRQFLDDGGIIPTNLCIRLSIIRMDDGVPEAYQTLMRRSHQIAYSAVHTTPWPEFGGTCIAYTQDGECRDCRACFTPSVAGVSYPKHS